MGKVGSESEECEPMAALLLLQLLLLLLLLLPDVASLLGVDPVWESSRNLKSRLKSQSQMRKSQLRARVAKENVVWAFQRLGKFLIVELENFIIHLSHLLNQVLVLVALTPREQQLYSAFVALQRFLAASMQ
jgi:hypothetical protein